LLITKGACLQKKNSKEKQKKISAKYLQKKNVAKEKGKKRISAQLTRAAGALTKLRVYAKKNI
jgi:hypothetical protein